MTRKNADRILQRISDVKALPLRKGKSELLTHLEGGREITKSEAIIAKCFECSNGYDEVGDCKISTCPLHDFMPYRDGGARKRPRTLTDEQRQAASVRLQKARAKRGEGA